MPSEGSHPNVPDYRSEPLTPAPQKARDFLDFVKTNEGFSWHLHRVLDPASTRQMKNVGAKKCMPAKERKKRFFRDMTEEQNPEGTEPGQILPAAHPQGLRPASCDQPRKSLPCAESYDATGPDTVCQGPAYRDRPCKPSASRESSRSIPLSLSPQYVSKKKLSGDTIVANVSIEVYQESD
jgi:hypothetical protein